MGVEGTASPEAIIQAVEAAGYGASKKGAPGAAAKAGGSGGAGAAGDAEELLKDRETPVLKQQTDLVTGIFSGSHVFFHGTYDVGLAGSGVVGRQPCGHGSAAADSGRPS